VAGYTALFASLTTGSLCGRWPDVGMWPIILSLCDWRGLVDVNHDYLSRVTGLPIDEVKACMLRFCQPDAGSRSTAESGARLVLIDPEHRNWGWRVVNHGLYRDRARQKASDEARTASGRDKERKQRERGGGRSASQPVPACPPESPTVPLSSTSTAPSQTVNSNCELARARESRSGSNPSLRPSDKAIGKAMQGRFDITTEDLVTDFQVWAATKKGPWGNVDKAFLTFAARHEPTKEQRDRAIRQSRSKGKPASGSVSDLLRLSSTPGRNR